MLEERGTETGTSDRPGLDLDLDGAGAGGQGQKGGQMEEGQRGQTGTEMAVSDIGSD